MAMKRAVLAMTCTAFAAACGVESLVDVTSTADALEVAQTDYCTIRAEADQCRADFEACVLAAGADTEACRTALHACLPRPPRPEGGRCEDGGVRRPPPDGGQPPPRDGHHRGGPRGPHPEPAAIDACRTALSDCLAASPGDATCLETERTCIHDAFAAAFAAACADAAAGCTNLPADAPADACTRLQQRCAEGVGVCTQ